MKSVAAIAALTHLTALIFKQVSSYCLGINNRLKHELSGSRSRGECSSSLESSGVLRSAQKLNQRVQYVVRIGH